MEKLRAGVIGLGFIGMQHVDAIMRVPQAQLAAVRLARGLHPQVVIPRRGDAAAPGASGSARRSITIRGAK